MTFSSLFFVLFFLPLFLLVYYKVPAIERKNKVLLIFSLIFYVWGGIRYFLLLLAMTAIGWYFALQIQRQDKKDARRRKCWLIFAILLFLTVLGIFKYTGFFMDTLDIVFPISWNFPTFVLPLGISFYTFKLISYIADTYKGIVEAESSYLALLLYTSLFHHCTAGPIVRYAPFRKELADRSATVSSIADGLCRFCVGLAKKSILADHCGVLANSLLPLSGHLSGTPASGIWLGSLLYMLQIYLDFSAYSDMAIGLGWMVGFHYEENFRYPYAAVSIKDFWKRWHISLSTFFRDYVYIPLGGSRCGTWRTVRNLLVVWALTGLWHGANWNYVLWGFYYFIWIVFENWLRKKQIKPWPALFQHLYTLSVIYVGWILFRFENLSDLRTVFRGMFGGNQNVLHDVTVGITLKNNLFFLLVAFLTVTPLFPKLHVYLKHRFTAKETSQTLWFIGKIIFILLLFLLSLLALVGNSYTPFLYNQF